MERNNFSNNCFINPNSLSNSIINEKCELNNKYLKERLKHDENVSLNKEERYKNFDKFHKQYIFDKNYSQKISLFSQANQVTTNKSKDKRNFNTKKNNDLSLDEYLEELKQQYDEDPMYFESMNETTHKYFYRFSFCFFCHHLAFAYKDKVTCVNKCFIMDIQTSEFNKDYTLDHLLESHYEYYENHLECNSDIIPLYIDEKSKQPFFICTNCDGKILEANGIIL